MSSGASSSSPPPAEAADGYWEAREEAAALLEAMAARAQGDDELSAEQLETNNQLQEDEVTYRPAPPAFEFTRTLGASYKLQCHLSDFWNPPLEDLHETSVAVNPWDYSL